MTPEVNTVAVITSTIAAIAGFGAIVKWGITKYFEKADKLEALKESIVLKEIGKISVDLQMLNSKQADTHVKMEKLSTSVNLVMKNYIHLNQTTKLAIQSNHEVIDSVKKALDRMDEIELKIEKR